VIYYGISILCFLIDVQKWLKVADGAVSTSTARTSRLSATERSFQQTGQACRTLKSAGR